jgi:hypothetical protein
MSILCLVWESGAKGERRRHDDGREIGCCVVVVPARDHPKVKQGVNR